MSLIELRHDHPAARSAELSLIAFVTFCKRLQVLREIVAPGPCLEVRLLADLQLLERRSRVDLALLELVRIPSGGPHPPLNSSPIGPWGPHTRVFDREVARGPPPAFTLRLDFG